MGNMEVLLALLSVPLIFAVTGLVIVIAVLLWTRYR